MPVNTGFSYTLIGFGRVGAALDAALNSIGGVCHGIITSGKNSHAVALPQHARFCSFTEFESSDYVFLAVPDDAIETVARSLPIPKLLEANSTVVHLSGSKPSSVLSELSDRGIPIASTHPLMTFKQGAQAQIFEGITVSIEGSDTAVNSLEMLFTQIGSKPIKVTAEQKKLLHLAAVITSNFMSSLVFYTSSVVQSMDEDPIEFVRQTFGPLMLKTAENIVNEGYPSALTGPASRGDMSTINDHLQLLRELNIDESIYKELSEQILLFTKHK